MHRSHLLTSFASIALFVGLPAFAQSKLPAASAAERAQAVDIFRQLIEINTTDTPQGNVTTATIAMEKR
ncbi:MAG TPA: hypothetical protein VGR64_10420, partial [Terracidiphilus sp.]|nr:hypothetical protein [Terracidiphilus sp.]